MEQNNLKVPDRIAFQFLLNSVANAPSVIRQDEVSYFRIVERYLDDYFRRKLDEFDVVKVAMTFNEPTFYYHNGGLSKNWLNSNFDTPLKNAGDSINVLTELVENKKMITLKVK